MDEEIQVFSKKMHSRIRTQGIISGRFNAADAEIHADSDNTIKSHTTYPKLDIEEIIQRYASTYQWASILRCALRVRGARPLGGQHRLENRLKTIVLIIVSLHFSANPEACVKLDFHCIVLQVSLLFH